eukprot:CAMPEP_0119266512 /NCGR_PEP_ID=MMETSP1329-20130426/4978_1 /TAXON_ID=114041 /ORGANISM="Genus nov. species nov., Strain RCC1024" /LENGTH=109 /DNA_ID=CAMNT_0007266395 /DNA_START=206 /DNA_END=535 /DNA_ORIENTATION=-
MQIDGFRLTQQSLAACLGGGVDDSSYVSLLGAFRLLGDGASRAWLSDEHIIRGACGRGLDDAGLAEASANARHKARAKARISPARKARFKFRTFKKAHDDVRVVRDKRR